MITFSWPWPYRQFHVRNANFWRVTRPKFSGSPLPVCPKNAQMRRLSGKLFFKKNQVDPRGFVLWMANKRKKWLFFGGVLPLIWRKPWKIPKLQNSLPHSIPYSENQMCVWKPTNACLEWFWCRFDTFGTQPARPGRDPDDLAGRVIPSARFSLCQG